MKLTIHNIIIATIEMKVLIFDTETTGLPLERNPSIYDSSMWPYIVQLSYILYDTSAKKALVAHDWIIKVPSDVVFLKVV